MGEIIDLLEYKRKKDEMALKQLQQEVDAITAKYPVFPEPYYVNTISELDVISLPVFERWDTSRFSYDERDDLYEYESGYDYNVTLELDYES